MHREFSPSERLGRGDTPLSLYLLTAILALLVGADVWPTVVGWTGWTWLPTWTNSVFGYRFALIAAVLGGSRILYASLESLLDGRLGADLALALACIAAILIGEPLVAAEVVFIGLLGEVLENWTFTRSQRAIQGLLEITPQRCWRLDNGQEMRVLVSELKVGDVVVVKPGARVPADGVIRVGRSTLDVSALTGESLPQEVGPEQQVLAGALNQLGALTIEATRVAEQTVVGRVLSMTVAALQQKSRVERTVDRLARFFLPAVLGLAALTFLVALMGYSWWTKPLDGALKPGLAERIRLAAYPALSVLVVACPCALILATPAAILAAMGRLAGTGILIKGGGSLERLAEVNAFAFDKTGTLTEGRLELGDLLPLEGVTETELLLAAALAEQRSEHPLAQLILVEARRRELALSVVEEFQAHPGGGVTAHADGTAILVGTARLMQEQGITVGESATELLRQLDERGQTALLVAQAGRLLGAIGARDRVRPEAADVLTELRNLGIADISLLTGDRTATARLVAEQLAIADVHAELLPEQKAERVAQKAFVGDGVNDAPALARAHVGLAIGGTGTDVAAEAGDVVFLGPPLRHLPLLVKLSRQTVQVIRQNILVFAFGVNLAGVVLTAWLWPLLAPRGWWYEQSPLVAVLYHQLGSLLVLLNSMRLLWFERAASPRAVAWNRRAVAVNAWLERYVNVEDWLHGIGHHWRKAFAVVVGLALLGYALSGITIVRSDEVGVARRFGRVLPDDLTPGFHWRWPWPIEQVTRLQPRRWRSVEVGYRSLPARPGSDVRGWASAHGDGIRRYPDESVMITGDENLIEVLATVQYSIADVRVYLFGVSQPEAALRLSAEAVLRELVAGRAFTPLLTSQRELLQGLVLERLRQRSADLGVRLHAVTLQELHPPPEVVAAFHEVARAMETEQRLINDARAAETLAQGQSDARIARQDRDADAERTQLLREAATTLQVFLDRWQAREELTLRQDALLLWETLGRWKRGMTQEELNGLFARRRQEELSRQARWSAERLRREVLSRTLPEREMVLIDAPPGIAALLYALDQVREVLGPLLAASRVPRPSRAEEP